MTVRHSVLKNQAIHDNKTKDDLSAIGQVLYLSYDESARELNERPEIDSIIDMNGKAGDENRSKVVKKLLEIIGKTVRKP